MGTKKYNDSKDKIDYLELRPSPTSHDYGKVVNRKNSKDSTPGSKLLNESSVHSILDVSSFRDNKKVDDQENVPASKSD